MVPEKRFRTTVEVSVRSLDGRRGPARRLLVEAVRRAAATLGPGRYIVEVAYAGDAVMRRLNRRFHGSGGTTDVLAFPSFIDTPEGLVVGEVVVNRDAARRASQEGGGVMREMLRYVVHGVLHLAGFDDGNQAARRRMWMEQEQVLQSLFEKRGARKMWSHDRQLVSGKERG